MIWVLVGALAFAIVSFFLYFFIFRWRALARHGRLEVPSDTVIELPEGPLTVYYEDAFKWRFSETPKPWSGLSVLVSDERSGERIDLQKASRETIYKSSSRNRIPYAALEVPRAGRYRVRSQVDADAVEPHVTFG